MNRNQKVDFWLDNSSSVLLTGRSGVGKTSITLAGFMRNGLVLGQNVAYYSRHDQTLIGNLDEAKVVFFDNMEDPNIQAAAHEISRYKTWRGALIPAMRCIWGLFQYGPLGDLDPPEKDLPTTAFVEYPVPEFEDLFQIQVTVPFSPYLPYFTEKYGERVAKAAIEWWRSLNVEQTHRCSPRRLDLALEMCRKKGDMHDVLSHYSFNVAALANKVFKEFHEIKASE